MELLKENAVPIIVVSSSIILLITILINWLIKTDTALGRWLSISLRPPLRSDNLNETLKVNRLISNPLVLLIMIILVDLFFFALFTFGINILREIPNMVKGFMKESVPLEYYINTDQLFPKFNEYGVLSKASFIIFVIFMLISDIRIGYMMRLSYSEKALKKGNSGTQRWTTLKELTQQYKRVKMDPSTNGKTNYFKGRGGMPIARWRRNFYIDSQLTNNLFLGATRSGKGEMFVFPLIDILSRAEKQENRPSMIIFDPKLELYKSAYETLKKRGYEVRLLNLDNPLKSEGYNPLTIMTEFWKRGRIDEAKQLARSFSFGIFNSSNDSQEPIWKNTSTDLWTAMIVAHISDCLESDSILNYKRAERFATLRQAFLDLYGNDEVEKEEIEERRKAFAKVYLNLKEGEDFLDVDLCNQYSERGYGIPDYINYIPEYIEKEGIDGVPGERIEIKFNDIHPNEKNINCFSCLNFFKELVDTTSVTAGEEQVAGAKKAETALDDYFNARPKLDYAKSLYAEIKSAGDRTKGSVYINMQSALSIFTLDSIARLTAENDIDIASLGFDKEKPTAVFLGIPTEDESNHFLALTFVSQVFQYLWKLSKEGQNKLDREVQFILDEFGNMPVLSSFKGMVTNCLGAGIAFNIFVQSYNQLNSNYEMDVDTIKDNFANQFYIMAVGGESAREFSEQLGNKEVIELQRSGTLLSMKKSVMENPKERPLLYPQELQNFREGETALIRAAKRTDTAGAGIKSYPIIDEYQDSLYIWSYLKILFSKILLKRVIKREKMIDRDTKEKLTLFEEWRYWVSVEKRFHGTAFLYRYQYATKDFPNPTEINFNEVFNVKGRDTVDYLNLVLDVDEVKERLGIEVNRDSKKYEAPRIADLDDGTQSLYYNYCTENLGYDFHDKLGLSKTMRIDEVTEKITKYINELSSDEKQRLIKNDFIRNLNSILQR